MLGLIEMIDLVSPNQLTNQNIKFSKLCSNEVIKDSDAVIIRREHQITERIRNRRNLSGEMVVLEVKVEKARVCILSPATPSPILKEIRVPKGELASISPLTK